MASMRSIVRLALVGRHAVDLPQPVHQLLLGLRGQPVEARFALQGPFLLLGGQVPMPCQPGAEMGLLVVFKSRARTLLRRPGEAGKRSGRQRKYQLEDSYPASNRISVTPLV